MKKIQLKNTRLQLAKDKVTSLRDSRMRLIMGGAAGSSGTSDDTGDEFTYSLSWGARCIESKSYGVKNPKACREAVDYAKQHA